MKLIIWLWNPGIKYDSTRHNVWFMFLDWLKTELNSNNDFKLESKFQAEILELIWNREKILLVKPQTFMNLSWESVLKLMSFYKIQKEDIMVIFDDISLEPGKVRFREKWSAWWQNGVKNIISHIWEDFKRIKIGIWYNQKWDLADWVLSKLSDEEKDFLYTHSFPEVKSLLCKHFNSLS